MSQKENVKHRLSEEPGIQKEEIYSLANSSDETAIYAQKRNKIFPIIFNSRKVNYFLLSQKGSAIIILIYDSGCK